MKQNILGTDFGNTKRHIAINIAAVESLAKGLPLLKEMLT